MFLVCCRCCCFVLLPFSIMHSNVCMANQSHSMPRCTKNAALTFPALVTLSQDSSACTSALFDERHRMGLLSTRIPCLVAFPCFFMSPDVLFGCADSTPFLCPVLGFIGDPAMCSPSPHFCTKLKGQSFHQAALMRACQRVPPL